MSYTLPYISIEVNEHCNQQCCFCYNPRVAQRDFTESNYHRLRRLLVRLYQEAKIGRVVFTGGEPLLEPRLAELVLFCKMRKSGVSIITNGTAAKKPVYKDLIMLQTDLFQLPVHHHHADIHDRMTGVAGSHAKSLDSIRIIRSLGSRVAVVVVITKHNVHELGETIRFIASLGINEISLNRCNISSRMKADALSLSPGKEILNQAYHEAHEVTRELKLNLSSNVNTPWCVLNPGDFPLIRFSGCSADVCDNPLTADADGNLRKCNHSPVVIGNVFDTPLETILSNDYLKSWNTVVPEFCSGCKHWYQCRGGCRAAAEQLGKSIADPDPLVYCSG